MIGAVNFKVTNEYNARIYMVGTYNQIDWVNEFPCALGENFTVYNFSDETPRDVVMTISDSVDDRSILRLLETKRYILRLIHKSGGNVEIPHFQNENNKFLKLDKDKDSVTFQFINYLGRSKITFNYDGLHRELAFEVVPKKMDYEEDYIKLTESLAQVCSELLLEYAGSTSNLYRQTEETSKTVLEQFIFLRQFCYSQNILSLFEAIKRNPDHLLYHDYELKPIGYEAPSRKFYINPFSYSRGWQKINRADGKILYMPQEISVTRKYDSIDTSANRFVKFALHKFDDICTELIMVLDAEGSFKQAECFVEAKAIHRMLEEIFNDGFFDDVGELDIMPQNNQVLQKREGYSQVFSAYLMIDLALQLNWKGMDEIYEGESKNVALLYEYWLFFELYKIISSIDDCKQIELKDKDFLAFSDDGLTISLEEGKKSRQSFVIERLHTKINLYYNRTFYKTEFETTFYEGSYSRPFRPDYTIAIFPDTFCGGNNNGESEAIKNGAVSYIHFDAKYRVSDITSLIGKNTDIVDEDAIMEDKADSITNTYKRGDLLKMHTYNDAIRRTIGSYVLYPGEKDNAEEKGNTFRLYDEILPGVGAFAIRPSKDEQGENELKTFILSLLESKGVLNSRLNRMRHYVEMVLREPAISSIRSEKVSCTASDKNNQHRGEQCVLGYIRADSDEDYYYSLKSNDLLINGAEFLFYFYAIKGNNVYSHHQDVFRATDFCFYKNSIDETNTYVPESILCKVESNELLSRTELVERLRKQGYTTTEEKHHADFYYVLKVRVIDDGFYINEMDVSKIGAQNGNDTFSPHSPKVILWKDQEGMVLND